MMTWLELALKNCEALHASAMSECDRLKNVLKDAERAEQAGRMYCHELANAVSSLRTLIRTLKGGDQP